MNTNINLFLRTGIGLLSCISFIFEVLLEIKFDATYALGICNWYLSLPIAEMSKCLARSAQKLRVRASMPSIIRSGLSIKVK